MKPARFLALLCAGAALASPPPRPVRLQYESPLAGGACPSEQEMKALVSAHLGRDPFSDGAPLTARVRILPRGGRLVGTLALVDDASAAAGSTALERSGGACGPLADTLAFDLAMAIDPQVLVGGPRREVEVAKLHGGAEQAPPPGPPTRGDGPPEQHPLAEAPVPSAGMPLHVNLLAGGSGSFGLLPAPAPGGTVELDLRWQDLSLVLGGTFFPYAGFDSLGGRVDTSMGLADAAGCGWIGPGAACLRVTGGLFHAGGTGFAGSRDGLLATAAAGAALAFQWRLGPKLLLKARLGASVPLLQSSIRVGTTKVWEVANVPLDGALLVGWALQ